MGADNKHLARLSTAVAEMSSGLVASRRSMMVFRSRMRSVEGLVADLGDQLGALDARYVDIQLRALHVTDICRDTVGLCDRLLESSADDEG